MADRRGRLTDPRRELLRTLHRMFSSKVRELLVRILILGAVISLVLIGNVVIGSLAIGTLLATPLVAMASLILIPVGIACFISIAGFLSIIGAISVIRWVNSRVQALRSATDSDQLNAFLRARLVNAGGEM